MNRRLGREVRELTKSGAFIGMGEVPSPSCGKDILIGPVNESDLSTWRAFIVGPPDSPFEGGRFEMLVQVPSAYPHTPPKIMFVTKVCHPNVHFKKGEICLDVLKAAWTPVWTLESACRAIIALLSNPEANSPLNCDAGNLVRAGDVRGYHSLARMYVHEYAQLLKK